jgi:hypothetical protein
VKSKASKKDKRSEKEEREEAALRAQLLHGRIAQEKRSREEHKQAAGSPQEEEIGSSASAPISSGAQRCNTCGGCFRDAQSYRDHFR